MKPAKRMVIREWIAAILLVLLGVGIWMYGPSALQVNAQPNPPTGEECIYEW